MEATQETLASVAEDVRFQQRTNVLKWFAKTGKVLGIPNLPIFEAGGMIPDGVTLGFFVQEMGRIVPESCVEIHRTIGEGAYHFASQVTPPRQFKQIKITGLVYQYMDHPDKDMRVEIQLWDLDRHLDAITKEVLVNEFKDLYSPGIGKPELVLTFTLSQTPHQTTRKTIWTFKGVKIGREEWPEMLTKIPEEIVQQPISNETPAPQGLFLPTGQTYAKIKEPEKMEEDTLYLFGVDPKILGRSLSKSNLEEKVKLLLERGTRMSEEDLASVKKMKVNFQKKDDIKFFLDEVLRVGNLWLYNAICHLLKEHEPAVEADRGDVCFKLSVKGNWQEYRDSVDAFVKVKVYLPKTLTEVAMVSGSMSI